MKWIDFHWWLIMNALNAYFSQCRKMMHQKQWEIFLQKNYTLFNFIFFTSSSPVYHNHGQEISHCFQWKQWTMFPRVHYWLYAGPKNLLFYSRMSAHLLISCMTDQRDGEELASIYADPLHSTFSGNQISSNLFQRCFKEFQKKMEIRVSHTFFLESLIVSWY